MMDTIESQPQLPPFQYEQLTSPRNIRLLRITRLHTHQQRYAVRKQLLECDLDACPKFWALSYAWGDPALNHAITVDGRRLPISHALHDALHDVARFILDDDDGSGVNLIWIDGICINQTADIAEKSVQVALMGDVYRKAYGTITYTGPGSGETVGALELASHCQRIEDAFSEHFGAEDGERMENDLASRLPKEGWVKYGFPPRGHWKYQALRQLLRKPWSSRAWIIQESVLNQKAIMLCGFCVVCDWDLLPNVVRLAGKGTCPSACVSTVDDPSSEGASYVQSLGNMRRDRVRESLKKTLSQLLRRTHNFQSGDPRDKIYSLLGLADDRDIIGIVPDYSLPVREVFVDATIRILRADPALEILSSVRNDKVLDLPSWAPDWSSADVEKCGTNNYLWFGTLVANGLFAAGGRGGSSRIELSADRTQLSARGVMFDRLRCVIEPSLNRRAGDTERPVQSILARCIEVAGRGDPPSPYGSAAGIREAFWRTLIANMTHLEREAEPDYGQSFDAFLRREESRARSIELLQLVPVDSETEAAASGFGVAANLVSMYRNIGVTRKGFVACVPNHAQEDDHVCVLLGGRIPFLLRDAGAGKFNLLGDCYVHGIMKGEAVYGVADEDMADIILV